jgi:hypothetical protein
MVAVPNFSFVDLKGIRVRFSFRKLLQALYIWVVVILFLYILVVMNNLKYTGEIDWNIFESEALRSPDYYIGCAFAITVVSVVYLARAVYRRRKQRNENERE